jgi:hypothetical protein
MKSVKYIDLAIAKLGLKNDFGLSKHMGWSTGSISMYRTGKRVMDDEACLALAMILDVNPIEIVGAACIDRAEKTGQKSLWEVFMSRTAATAASALLFGAVTGFLTPQDANARTYSPAATDQSDSLYIM